MSRAPLRGGGLKKFSSDPPRGRKFFKSRTLDRRDTGQAVPVRPGLHPRPPTSTKRLPGSRGVPRGKRDESLFLPLGRRPQTAKFPRPPLRRGRRPQTAKPPPPAGVAAAAAKLPGVEGGSAPFPSCPTFGRQAAAACVGAMSPTADSGAAGGACTEGAEEDAGGVRGWGCI